ncbi:MAG: hypothetical protein AAGD23_13900, partial [Pseudomonadota bacterium]
RAEAVHALDRIAAATSKQSDAARQILFDAISGSLVKAPDDWQPDHDRAIALPPRKGAQAAGDEGDANIRIDRDGNIIEEPKDTPTNVEGDQEIDTDHSAGPDDAEDSQTSDPEPPTSTLGAILSFEPPAAMTEEAVELDDEHLELLEMASGNATKRKIDPNTVEPAHVDVRRFAVRVAQHKPHECYIPALAFAAEDYDTTLATTALDALASASQAGISIATIADTVLMLAEWTNPDIKARAVTLLGAIDGDAAAVSLRRCLVRESDPHTLSAAVSASSQRLDIDFDFSTYVTHEHPRVRSAAAAVIASTAPNDVAVPALMAFARAGHSDHHIEAARLLSGREELAAPTLAMWIDGEDANLRHKAIEMIGLMWSDKIVPE